MFILGGRAFFFSIEGTDDKSPRFGYFCNKLDVYFTVSWRRGVEIFMSTVPVLIFVWAKFCT